LNAPFIAMLWQEMVAQAWTVQLFWPERAVLGLTVWGIYLLDRYGDARRDAKGFCCLRHQVARKFPGVFLFVGMIALAMAAWLAMNRIPSVVFFTGIPVTLLAGGYLIWHHRRPDGSESSPFRSLLVASVFSGGILAAPVGLLWTSPPGYSAILLLLIGLLACNHHEVSEAEERENGRPSWGIPLALPLILAVLGLFLLSFSPFAIAAAVSFFSLTAVAAIRRQISPSLQAVLADLSLLLHGFWLFYF